MLSDALKPPPADPPDDQGAEESGKDLPVADAGGNPLASLPLPPLASPTTTAPAPDAISLERDVTAQKVPVSLPPKPPAAEPLESAELPAAAISKQADQPIAAVPGLEPEPIAAAISGAAAAIEQGAPAIPQGAPAISQGAPVMSRSAPVMSQGAPVVSQGAPAISPGVEQPSPPISPQHSTVLLEQDDEALARSASAATLEQGGAAPQAQPSVESAAPLFQPVSKPGAEPAISAQELPRIHLQQPGWEQALAQRVTVMVDQATQRAHLQVHPPQLGPIEVHIDMTDDGASVQFSSPHASVRESIEAAAPRLREMLSGSGLQLLSLDVSAQAFSRQQHHDAPQTPAPRVGFAYASAAPAVRVRVGLLDVYA